MRFLSDIDGLLGAPPPKAESLPSLLLMLLSIGIVDCLIGEPPGKLKWPELLELVCLAGAGHISSLGPGV